MITIHFIENILNTYAIDSHVAPIRVNDLEWYECIDKKSGKHNESERLEYLGDSFLGAVVGEYLYDHYQDQQEGFLTKLRTKIVRSDQLVKFSLMLQLDKHVCESARCSPKLLEDAFEVLIGAIVKDQAPFGYESARRFILGLLRTLDFSDLTQNNDNYKGALLNYYQSRGWQHPVYREVSTGGSNYQKVFTYSVLLDKSLVKRHQPLPKCLEDDFHYILGIGSGKTKKEAEQACSKKALALLDVQVSGI